MRRVAIEHAAKRDRSNFAVDSSHHSGKQRICTRCQEPSDNAVKWENHWWCPSCLVRVQRTVDEIRRRREHSHTVEPERGISEGLRLAIRNKEAQ